MGKRRFQELGRDILDLVFPRTCLATGEWLRGNTAFRYFSKEALEAVIWVKTPHCAQCGVPFEGEVIGSRICPHCVTLAPSFDFGKTAFILKGVGRRLVHVLKYKDGYFLWPDVESLLKKTPEYLEFLAGSVLVPVPLHPRKLRERGFNQSLLLAKCLHKNSQAIGVQELIIRTRHTKTQTQLSRDERLKNVKNAFALSPRTVINSSLKYTLVDDVYTTGATLSACAGVLKKHGAREVNVITLGHG